MWFISPAATGGVSSVALDQPPPNMPLQHDINAAFLSYAIIGALDPRNLLDAKGLARLFGISYVGGLGVAAVAGALMIGVGITVIDPKHKYAGGWDDTKSGEAFFNRRKISRSSIMASQSQSITGMPVLTYQEPTWKYDPYYS